VIRNAGGVITEDDMCRPVRRSEVRRHRHHGQIDVARAQGAEPNAGIAREELEHVHR